MIHTKQELIQYIEQDAKANYRDNSKCKIYGDDIWKFIKCLRYLQYYNSRKGQNVLVIIPFVVLRWYFRRISMKLGFSIPWKTEIGKGFCLVHYGTIVINDRTKIGDNFKCHAGVNIGATNGNPQSAVIGNNVYVGPGAKIVGNINIPDDVVIGANAVVVKSIDEPGTTWGGVPAKKISNRNSHIHMCERLELE